MTRISFVEFLCILAIGVAMVEAPGHGFLKQSGARAAPEKMAATTPHATVREVNVRPLPPEKNQ